LTDLFDGFVYGSTFNAGNLQWV